MPRPTPKKHPSVSATPGLYKPGYLLPKVIKGAPVVPSPSPTKGKGLPAHLKRSSASNKSPSTTETVPALPLVTGPVLRAHDRWRATREDKVKGRRVIRKHDTGQHQSNRSSSPVRVRSQSPVKRLAEELARSPQAQQRQRQRSLSPEDRPRASTSLGYNNSGIDISNVTVQGPQVDVHGEKIIYGQDVIARAAQGEIFYLVQERSKHKESHPYNLRVINRYAAPKDYYNMTSNGVVQVLSRESAGMTSGEYMPLDEWFTESKAFHMVRSLRSFRHYLVGKMWRRWKKFVAMKHFRALRAKFEAKWLFKDIHFSHNRGLIVQACESFGRGMKVLSARHSADFINGTHERVAVYDFMHYLNLVLSNFGRRLRKFAKHIHEIISDLLKTIMTKIVKMRALPLSMREAAKRYICFVDCYLRSTYINAINTCLSGIQLERQDDEYPYIHTTLSYDVGGTPTISPDKQKLLQTLEVFSSQLVQMVAGGYLCCNQKSLPKLLHVDEKEWAVDGLEHMRDTQASRDHNEDPEVDTSLVQAGGKVPDVTLIQIGPVTFEYTNYSDYASTRSAKDAVIFSAMIKYEVQLSYDPGFKLANKYSEFLRRFSPTTWKGAVDQERLSVVMRRLREFRQMDDYLDAQTAIEKIGPFAIDTAKALQTLSNSFATFYHVARNHLVSAFATRVKALQDRCNDRCFLQLTKKNDFFEKGVEFLVNFRQAKELFAVIMVEYDDIAQLNNIFNEFDITIGLVESRIFQTVLESIQNIAYCIASNEIFKRGHSRFLADEFARQRKACTSEVRVIVPALSTLVSTALTPDLHVHQSITLQLKAAKKLAGNIAYLSRLQQELNLTLPVELIQQGEVIQGVTKSFEELLSLLQWWERTIKEWTQTQLSDVHKLRFREPFENLTERFARSFAHLAFWLNDTSLTTSCQVYSMIQNQILFWENALPTLEALAVLRLRPSDWEAIVVLALEKGTATEIPLLPSPVSGGELQRRMRNSPDHAAEALHRLIALGACGVHSVRVQADSAVQEIKMLEIMAGVQDQLQRWWGTPISHLKSFDIGNIVKEWMKQLEPFSRDLISKFPETAEAMERLEKLVPRGIRLISQCENIPTFPSQWPRAVILEDGFESYSDSILGNVLALPLELGDKVFKNALDIGTRSRRRGAVTVKTGPSMAREQFDLFSKLSQIDKGLSRQLLSVMSLKGNVAVIASSEEGDDPPSARTAARNLYQTKSSELEALLTRPVQRGDSLVDLLYSHGIHAPDTLTWDESTPRERERSKVSIINDVERPPLSPLVERDQVTIVLYGTPDTRPVREHFKDVLGTELVSVVDSLGLRLEICDLEDVLTVPGAVHVSTRDRLYRALDEVSILWPYVVTVIGDCDTSEEIDPADLPRCEPWTSWFGQEHHYTMFGVIMQYITHLGITRPDLHRVTTYVRELLDAPTDNLVSAETEYTPAELVERKLGARDKSTREAISNVQVCLQSLAFTAENPACATPSYTLVANDVKDRLSAQIQIDFPVSQRHTSLQASLTRGGRHMRSFKLDLMCPARPFVNEGLKKYAFYQEAGAHLSRSTLNIATALKRFSHSTNFISDIDSLMKFSHPMLLSGPPESGKTVVLSQVTEDIYAMAAKQPHTIVLSHFVGHDRSSYHPSIQSIVTEWSTLLLEALESTYTTPDMLGNADPITLFWKLVNVWVGVETEVSFLYSGSKPVGQESLPQKVVETLSGFTLAVLPAVEHIGDFDLVDASDPSTPTSGLHSRSGLSNSLHERRVVIVLDGIDYLAELDELTVCSWLPEQLPKNVRAIISARPGYVADTIQKQSHANLLKLGPMSMQEQLAFLESTPSLADGNLDETSRLNRILLGTETFPGSIAPRPSPAFLSLGNFAFRSEPILEQTRRRVKYFQDLFGYDVVRVTLELLLARPTGLTRPELLDVILPVLQGDSSTMGRFSYRSSHYLAVLRFVLQNHEHNTECVFRIASSALESVAMEIVPIDKELHRLKLQQKHTLGHLDAVALCPPAAHDDLIDTALALATAQPRANGLWSCHFPAALDALPFHMWLSGQKVEAIELLTDIDFIQTCVDSGNYQSLLSCYRFILFRNTNNGEIVDAASLNDYQRDLLTEFFTLIHFNDVITRRRCFLNLALNSPHLRRVFKKARAYRGHVHKDVIRSLTKPPPSVIFTKAYYTFKHSCGTVATIFANQTGSRLLGVGTDDVLVSWSVHTKKKVPLPLQVKGKCQRITCLASDPQGEFMVVGNADGMLVVVSAGHSIPTVVDAHSSAVVAVVIPAGGSSYISVAEEIRVWDRRDGRPVRTIGPSFLNSYSCAAMCYDGTCIITGSRQHQVLVWDTLDGELEFRATGHSGPITCCAFLTDKRADAFVSGSTDSTIRIYSRDNQGLIQMIERHAIPTAVVGHKSWLFTAARDVSVTIHHVPSGQLVRSLCGHISPVMSLAIDPQENYLLTAGRDTYVKIWSLREHCHKEPLPSREGAQKVHQITFSPDETHCIITFSYTTDVVICELPAGLSEELSQPHTRIVQHSVNLPTPHSLSVVAFSTTSEAVAFGTLGGQVYVWPLKALLQARYVEASELPSHFSNMLRGSYCGHPSQPVTFCAFSDDEQSVMSCTGGDKNVVQWDVRSSRLIRRISTHARTILNAGLYQGCILTFGRDHIMQLCDVQTGDVVHSVGTKEDFGAATVLPDYSFLLAPPQKGTIYVFLKRAEPVRSPAQILSPSAEEDAFEAGTFSIIPKSPMRARSGRHNVNRVATTVDLPMVTAIVDFGVMKSGNVAVLGRGDRGEALVLELGIDSWKPIHVWQMKEYRPENVAVTLFSISSKCTYLAGIQGSDQSLVVFTWYRPPPLSDDILKTVPSMKSLARITDASSIAPGNDSDDELYWDTIEDTHAPVVSMSITTPAKLVPRPMDVPDSSSKVYAVESNVSVAQWMASLSEHAN